MNKARFETFSDGVFAIVATLLVLDFHVPELRVVNSAALWSALAALWPHYLAYATSFLVVGIYWLNHHSMSHYVRYCDRRLMWRNLLFLMTVAFVPFPTMIIAQYGDVPAGVLFYGLILFISSLMVNLMWRYIVRNGYLDESLIGADDIRRAGRRYAVGAIIYVVAIGLAPFAPRISILLYALLAIYYLLPGGLERNTIAAPAP